MVYTVHTARILQSPPDPAIFNERGQPLSIVALSGLSAQRRDQLNCPLIWAILKPRVSRRIAARSGVKILVVLVWQPKTIIFFI